MHNSSPPHCELHVPEKSSGAGGGAGADVGTSSDSSSVSNPPFSLNGSITEAEALSIFLEEKFNTNKTTKTISGRYYWTIGHQIDKRPVTKEEIEMHTLEGRDLIKYHYYFMQRDKRLKQEEENMKKIKDDREERIYNYKKLIGI